MIFKIQDQISKYFRIRGLSLYFVQAPLWVALPIHLFRGRASAAFFDLVLITGVLYAAKLTQDFFRTSFPPIDRRPLAAFCLSLAVMIFFIGTLRRSPTLGILFGLLAGIGYMLTYFGEQEIVPTKKLALKPQVLSLKPPEKIEKPDTTEFNLPKNLPPTLKDMLLDGYWAIEGLEENSARLVELRHEKRLGLKLKKIANKAREIIEQIKSSPEQIRAARAFLIIHLAELHHISTQYLLDIDRPNHDQQRKSFYHLLCESEEAFTVQHLELINQQQERLEIQIQVLRDQLKQGNFHD